MYHNQECRLTIDTMYLVKRTTAQDKQIIQDRFKLPKNTPDKFYHYTLNQTEQLGFTIHSMPKNTYTHKYYDHQIQLQRQVTVDRQISSSLLEVIDQVDWQIKRLDLAFDLKTDKEKSMIFNHNGNIKFDTKDEWDGEYLGKLKTRSLSKVASYDRNVKERKHNTNVHHIIDNRYEVRLFPKCTNDSMRIKNMSDDFIIKHLSKYIIIPNIDDLNTGKWNKNYLYKIKQDYSYLKTLPIKKQQELRAICKQHRLPLEQIYLDNKANLFQFLNDPVASPQDVPALMQQVL